MINRGSGREENAFAEFGIQEYLENPLLIHVLKVTESNARIATAKLVRDERVARRELEVLKTRLAEELVRHEQTRGSTGEAVARLETTVENLEEQVAESRRLSSIAVIVTWVGSALVAIGVNIMTGTENNALGLGIVVAGAVVEVAAFFVRQGVRKTSPRR